MKTIKTREAVGHILCHDMTRIVRGESKGVAFKKGHVVKEEDIPMLLSMGKDSLYVWEHVEGMLHEDEAAEYLIDVCMNDHFSRTETREGKIGLVAECDGLYAVDVDRLAKINGLTDIMIASRHNNFPVKKGDQVAAMRVIPLVIEKEKVEAVKEVGGEQPLMSLKPYLPMKVGMITTGNEVFHGRIEDTFGPVIKEKLMAFNVSSVDQVVLDDSSEAITAQIEKMVKAGYDMVVLTGGMSVDPDDRTPGAIKATGADIVSYGSPVLPGAMFLVSYLNGTPVLGIPGCAMYAKATVLDLALPLLMTGQRVTKEYLSKLGHGGLCLNCEVCHFPNCSFGKGAY